MYDDELCGICTLIVFMMGGIFPNFTGIAAVVAAKGEIIFLNPDLQGGGCDHKEMSSAQLF